jgi:hypothetical protein
MMMVMAAEVATAPRQGQEPNPAERPGVSRQVLGAVASFADALFGGVSLLVLLAVVATIPVLQFFTLGYLLRASARVAKGGRLREAFVGVREASRIGQFVLGAWLVSLVPRLVLSLRADALLVAPGAGAAKALLVMTGIASVLVGWVGVAALSRGGRLIGFIRPIRATRQLLAEVRAGELVDSLKGGVLQLRRAFEPWATFSLGFRGYLGAMLWLLIPTTLIAVGRKGVLAVLGGVGLAVVVTFLPFVQMHFAVNGTLRDMFRVGPVRQAFRRAPVAFFVALFVTLLLAIPLYLLKVELVPRDAQWLPAVVFVLTIFPTKLLTAWAYRRGTQRSSDAHGVWRWSMRPLLFAAAGIYTFVVFLTQYTGWHGVVGLYEHHAFLLPVPFGTPAF